MNIKLQIATIPALLIAANLAFADIPECVNANHSNTADVQRCISKIPGMNALLPQANGNPMFCASTSPVWPQGKLAGPQ